MSEDLGAAGNAANDAQTQAQPAPDRMAALEQKFERMIGVVGNLADSVSTLTQGQASPPAAVPVGGIAGGEVVVADNPADIQHPPMGVTNPDGSPVLKPDGQPVTGYDRISAIESRLQAWEPYLLDIVRVGATVASGGSTLGAALLQAVTQLGHAGGR